MSAAARPVASTGCVLRSVAGLVEVLTDRGPVTASLGGAVLARVAADPSRRPAAGDWVALTWWPDGPVTVERTLAAPGPGEGPRPRLRVAPDA